MIVLLLAPHPTVACSCGRLMRFGIRQDIYYCPQHAYQGEVWGGEEIHALL